PLQIYTEQEIVATGPLFPDPRALGFAQRQEKQLPRPYPRYMLVQPRVLRMPPFYQDEWDRQNQEKMLQLEASNNGSDFQGLYEEFQKMREVERAKMEQLGLVDAENTTKDLNDAIRFQGTCLDMCPTFERVRRALENNVKALEKDFSSQKISRARAVKAFSRPAAGQPPPMPSDVRPPHVLVQTLDYLVGTVLPQLPDSHSFLWDRTRSIRQDFVYQNNYGPEAIECNEKIVRIHLLCMHIMANADVEFSHQQEMEQFNKALQTLMEMYQDVRNHGGVCPNEAEFRAYHLLSHYRDPEVEREVQTLPDPIFKDPQVQLALRFRVLMSQNNIIERGHTNKVGAANMFVRFFELAYSHQIPVLMACLLETHFDELRFYALKSLSRSYHSGGKALLGTALEDMLGFDSLEEMSCFVLYYEVDTFFEDGVLLVDLCNNEKLDAVYKLKSLTDKPKRAPATSQRIDQRLRANPLKSYVNVGVPNTDLKFSDPFSKSVLLINTPKLPRPEPKSTPQAVHNSGHFSKPQHHTAKAASNGLLTLADFTKGSLATTQSTFGKVSAREPTAVQQTQSTFNFATPAQTSVQTTTFPFGGSDVLAIRIQPTTTASNDQSSSLQQNDNLQENKEKEKETHFPQIKNDLNQFKTSSGTLSFMFPYPPLLGTEERKEVHVHFANTAETREFTPNETTLQTDSAKQMLIGGAVTATKILLDSDTDHELELRLARQRTANRQKMIDVFSQELLLAFVSEVTYQQCLRSTADHTYTSKLRKRAVNKVTESCRAALARKKKKQSRLNELESATFKIPATKRRHGGLSAIGKRRKTEPVDISCRSVNERPDEIKSIWQPVDLIKFAEKCSSKLTAQARLTCWLVVENWALAPSKWLANKFSMRSRMDGSHYENKAQASGLTIRFEDLQNSTLKDDSAIQSTAFIVFECGLVGKEPPGKYNDLAAKLTRDSATLAKIVQVCSRVALYKVLLLVLVWDASQSGMNEALLGEHLHLSTLANERCVHSIQLCNMAADNENVFRLLESKLAEIAECFNGLHTSRAIRQNQIARVQDFPSEKQDVPDISEVRKSIEQKEQELLKRARVSQHRGYLSKHLGRNVSVDLTNTSAVFKTPNASFANKSSATHNRSILNHSLSFLGRDASLFKSFATGPILEESTPFASPRPQQNSLPNQILDLRKLTASIKERYRK
ncbi:mRNA export factor Sac3, partial [Metschnikowia bicuspidata]